MESGSTSWMYDQQGGGFEEVVFEESQRLATQYIRCNKLLMANLFPHFSTSLVDQNYHFILNNMVKFDAEGHEEHLGIRIALDVIDGFIEFFHHGLYLRCIGQFEQTLRKINFIFCNVMRNIIVGYDD